MKLEKDFGQYGGQYVPETLMTVLKVLEKEYEEYCFTRTFKTCHKCFWYILTTVLTKIFF